MPYGSEQALPAAFAASSGKQAIKIPRAAFAVYDGKQAPALKSAHHLPSTSRRIFGPHGQKTGASVADCYPQGGCRIRKAAALLPAAQAPRTAQINSNRFF